MKICRACLAASESEPLIPFDYMFLIYYNSLTNLNVTLDDSLPKYCCQSCVNAVDFFAQFRKKCTENENTLRAAIEKTNLDKNVTQLILEQAANDIKLNTIKTEDINHFDSTEEEEECYEFFDYVEDDGCSVKEEEIGSENNNKNNTEKDNDNKQIKELGTTTCKKNGQKTRKGRSNVKTTKVIDKTPKNAGNDNKLITELGTTTLVENEQKTRKGRSKVKTINAIDKTHKIADKRKSKYNKNKRALLSKSLETSENTSLLCGICTKKDFDDKTLKTHLENHKTSKQCELCEEKVWSWPQLFGHRLQHLPKPQQMCHLCGRSYRSSAYLEFHYLNFHNDGQEKVIKCNKCWRNCATPRKLSQHLQAVHSDMKYTCDYCSKSFRGRNILLRHILCHSEEKAYKCDLCPFACKLSNGLSVNNQNKIRSFISAPSHYQLSSSKSFFFQIHKLHKHNPTKVICKQCGRPFVSQEKMDLHYCRSRSVICPECGKRVARTHGLHKHMESHKTVGKYKCDRCPAVYKYSSGLKTHKNQHDGIRDKKCEFCPATFFYSSVLIKHRRTHTGEKPYVCKVCSKSFTGNHNLKVHMQIHGEFIINKKNEMDLSSSELK